MAAPRCTTPSAEAVPMAQGGQNRKKAIVIISDGNDTNSRVDVVEVRQMIRETEVLVYAVGIDGQGEPTFERPPMRRRSRGCRFRFRFPAGAAAARRSRCRRRRPLAGGGGRARRRRSRQRRWRCARSPTTAAAAPRSCATPRDLDPATASIADELSQQ